MQGLNSNQVLSADQVGATLTFLEIFKKARERQVREFMGSLSPSCKDEKPGNDFGPDVEPV